MNLKKNLWLAWVCIATAFLTTTGCAQRQTAQSITVYDLGLGRVTQTTDSTTDKARPLSPPALAMPAIQASRALDSNVVYYRLMYRDALQPKPYALARWSMPPAELMDQQLRDLLGANRTLIHPQDNLQAQPGMMLLHLQLDEFSQVFETPDKSYALLKIRATLAAPDSKGARLIAQRSFIISEPSATLDAAGGVRALRQTVEKLAQELDQWVLLQTATLP